MIVLNEIKVRKCIAKLRLKKLAYKNVGFVLSNKEAILLCKLEMLIDNMLMEGELY